MVININLSKFTKRRKLPAVPGGSLVDLTGKIGDHEPASPPSTRPALPSQLIDLGKAPAHPDSHPPLPRVRPAASALIDHGKQARNPDSHPPHPPAPHARTAATRLIDHGKV